MFPSFLVNQSAIFFSCFNLSYCSLFFPSKFKAIKDSSSLISEKKKRDALKNDLIKVEKGLGGLLSAVHQEEKRLEQERRKTDMMKTKETLFKSLSSALEMIKLFCESFSKAQIPQVDVDSLFKEQLSIKDLFPNGSVTVFQTRQRRKEINYNTTLDEIVSITNRKLTKKNTWNNQTNHSFL